MDFEESDKENEGQGQGQGVDTELGDNKNTYFEWLALIDNVSNLTRDKWDDVFQKNIYEFFNLLAYLKDKNKREKKQIERWKKMN